MNEQEALRQSFTVHTYQLAALTPQAPRTLWISLWGEPEAAGMTANHAEIEFVPDGTPVNPPRYDHALSRIGIWFPVSQFDRIAAILRSSAGVRCFYEERPGKEPYAGIKDWNTKGTPPSLVLVEPDLGKCDRARCGSPGDGQGAVAPNR